MKQTSHHGFRSKYVRRISKTLTFIPATMGGSRVVGTVARMVRMWTGEMVVRMVVGWMVVSIMASVVV